MTVTSVVFLQGKLLEATQTTQYASVACKSIIDNARAVNTSASPVTLSINVVAGGGAAATSNLIVKNITLAAGATSFISELAGLRLDQDDFISTLAGTASVIALRLDGRQITTA